MLIQDKNVRGVVVMSTERVSDALRLIARGMPFSIPPIEGGLLFLLISIWLFG